MAKNVTQKSSDGSADVSHPGTWTNGRRTTVDGYESILIGSVVMSLTDLGALKDHSDDLYWRVWRSTGL
jgi:hypothetical protein